MAHVVTVNLKQDKDFRFAIHFAEGIPVLYGDETPPLGNGPTPAQLLAAAVGNCMSDSLLFAIRKFKQHPEPIQTTVAASVDRNAENRLREQLSEEELTVFDILTRPGPELSTEERDEVKKVARQLLDRLNALLVLDWRKRLSARAQIRLAIEDTLDEGLPRRYTKEIYDTKCEALFEHVYESYQGDGRSVYA